MPHLHRLHADDEGVGERGEDQQRGRSASDLRAAAREVNGVGDAGGGVEDERENVQRVGA